MRITKTIDVDVDVDLTDFADDVLLDECGRRGILPEDASIDEFTDDELQGEHKRRFADAVDLEKIYHEFSRRTDAPECLRQYLYEQIGRTLP
jgi:hypothetical protein